MVLVPVPLHIADVFRPRVVRVPEERAVLPHTVELPVRPGEERGRGRRLSLVRIHLRAARAVPVRNEPVVILLIDEYPL